MKKNIDNPIVVRILLALDFTKISEICVLMDKSSQTVNGMINRGTLVKNLEVEFIKRKVNVDWVNTGHGEMKATSAAAKDNLATSLLLNFELLKEAVNTQNARVQTLDNQITEILKALQLHAKTGDMEPLKMLGGKVK
jgi:hypothetical protein